MNKLNCEIIQDLMPSYLDGICSKSSKEAVEQHISGCEACRERLSLLKDTELNADTADRQELDFMKKVKHYFTLKNSIGAGLLFLLSLAVLLIVPEIELNIELELYYTLFPILTLGTFLLLSNYQKKPKWSRARIAAAALSALGILYSIFICAQFLNSLETQSGPFGMELNQVGPFLNGQLLFVIFTELLIFAGYAVSSVKKEDSFGLLPTINLAGCILCMTYRSYLFKLESLETLTQGIWHNTLQILLITLCVSLTEFAVMQIRRRRLTK